jgi:hypothetical protein
MTLATISLSGCRGAARPARLAPARSIVPRAAMPAKPLALWKSCLAISQVASWVLSLAKHSWNWASRPLSTCAFFQGALGPSPRIARRSSTLLNGPYDLRIANIFSAVAGPIAGPIPGTCGNSCDVAVLIFTGCAGGFFLANAQVPKSKNRTRGPRIASDRHFMAQI